MPPASFVAEATGSTPGGSTAHQVFSVPAAREPGDTYIAVFVQASGASHIDFTQDGMSAWQELASITLTNATVIIARRLATEADPSTIDIWLTTAPAWILSALIVYRGLDFNAAMVGSSGTNIAASTNFVCPSQTLATYSDLYVGIVGVTTAAAAVTPPAGTSEKHEHSLSARELEIFTFHAEAPGATGTKTATTAGAQSGVAASIALAAGPLIGAGMSFSLTPIGTIGLPAEGV